MDRMFNILLVDEPAEDGGLIEQALQGCGLRTHFKRAYSLHEFVMEVQLGEPDLILADYAFAHFNVLEALSYLQKENLDIPVIVVSRESGEKAVVQAIKHGAQDYILRDSLVRLPQSARNALAKKVAERAKATTEAHYQLITESTRDLICLVDRSFHVLYASPSFKRVLNHDPKALDNIPFMSLVHPHDLPALEKSLEEALFFREGRNIELRICHADGTWQNFEATVSYIFHGNGTAKNALIVSRDTSERRQAEKEIRKLAAFPRFNPNPVMEFSSEGHLTYFNDAAMNLARSLRRPHPQMILPLQSPNIVKRCLMTGKSQLQIETPIMNRRIKWSFFPVAGNQVVHCYAEDVTEARNLEAQLRQAQKMDSIGQLAAGVAHDFNNILTVIQGHSSLMLEHAGLDPQVEQSIRQVSIAAERATSLTRQLLMFSRKQIMQPQLLDLNDVISNVTKMLRSILGEQITLKRELYSDLPAVHADPGMMEQILVNLAVNARDAIGSSGTVTVKTMVVETDDAYVQNLSTARLGTFACISVTDTGHGMDGETISHIFEPFFTTKEVGRGTGLGLATIYGIVKQHQGWIEVDSEVGRGSTFRVFFPVSTKAPARLDPHHRNEVPGGSETILVVEDESSLRELVQEILTKKGYRVYDAPNGVVALDIWKQRRNEIDLLLTDMMMPEGVSGKELADLALEEKKDLKILFTSGYSLEVVNPGFTDGAGCRFLQKPYHPETLAQAVRDCLGS